MRLLSLPMIVVRVCGWFKVRRTGSICIWMSLRKDVNADKTVNSEFKYIVVDDMM